MDYIYAQGGRLGDTSGNSIPPSEFERQGAYFTGRRPCFVWYRGELYVIGYYSRPLVQHKGDSGKFRLGGIMPPQRVLGLAQGSGTGGATGLCQGAITFLHKAGPRVLAESNYGNIVDMGELAGKGRLWTGIDSVSAELRVTHVRGYVSVDGGLFRMAWEAPYGLTTIEENVRTAALTFAGPVAQEYGVPPSTWYGHAWAGRMFYARNSTYPYRLWWSKAGYPQYVAPSAFRDTLDREAITGIWRGRNELVVFCYRATYLLRQFGAGANDFVLEKLDSDVGCLTHHGIQEIHNRLWFPSEDGPWIYDGSFRYLGKEIQPLWRDDIKANRAAYLDGFAVQDRVNKVYMFFTRRTQRPEFENCGLAPGTITWIGGFGNYDPSLAGEQPHPDWLLDMKYRFDSCAYYDEEGNLLIGSCDGKVREQDDADGDDDGDRIRKTAIIRSGHLLYNEPGDDLEGGKQLPQLWYYVKSELTDWSLYVRGGDEEAWRSKLPDNDIDGFWRANVVATQKSETRQIRTERSGRRTLALLYVPVTVHYFVPERVTGRGFTFELRADAPVGLEYRGFGGQWVPGSTARGIAERTTITAVLSLDGTPLDTFAPNLFPAHARYVPSVSIAYEYGSPAWPVRARLVCPEAGIDETLEFAGPGLAGNFVETITLGSVPTDSYWPMDEHSGTRTDMMGGAMNLTDVNGVGYGPGKVSNAAHFDETVSQYLKRNANGGELYPTGAFSLSCWIYPSGDPTPPQGSLPDSFISKCSASSTDRPYLACFYPRWGLVRIFVTGSDGNASYADTPANAAPLNTWTHVVLGYDPTDKLARLWINGTAYVAANPCTADPVSTGTCPFLVGCDYGTGSYAYFFDGLVDELRFYRGLWSTCERTALRLFPSQYNLTLTVTDANGATLDEPVEVVLELTT